MEPPEQLRWRLLQRPIPIVEIPWHSSLMERRSTDAVGGIVDRFTWSRLEKAGLSIHQILANNSAYHALKQVDGLIRTGPIGTNVNDVLVLLIQQAERT